MYRSRRLAAVPKFRGASHLTWLAALPMFLFGIGQAQATVQYQWVSTSIALNGVPLQPLQAYNVNFGVTDAAFQAGRASADLTCASGVECLGFNNGLVAQSFYRNTIDVMLRPDGLVDGSFTAIRASEEFTLTGTGLLWSGRYDSDYGYRTAATPNQPVYCVGALAGAGCTITGYFLAAPVTTSGLGVPVPEPASAALVAVGLLAMLRRRR